MAEPGAPSAGRVRRPSADPTRERILAEAADLFAERSFAGATTREIAARAGVTQPLLSYHFRNKEELWRAAVDALFASLVSALTELADELEGAEPLERAERTVRRFVSFSAQHPQLHRIIMQESKSDGDRMDHLVEQHVRPLYEATTGLFEELIADGLVPRIEPVHFFYLLTGAAATMFVLAPECRSLSGIDPQAPEVVAAHADAVCALLFGARS